MKLLLVLLGLLAVSSLFLFKFSSSDEYASFKTEYHKNYDNESVDEYRRAIFYENKASIDAWNALPNKSYEQGVNQFTDLTPAEFEQTYLGLLPQITEDASDEVDVNGDVDWTTKGAPFTKVKNQGSCGSCWAFSAVGGLEAINKIKLSKTNYFSEQMLVDCSKSYGNHGCNGGLMTAAYKFVRDKGIVEESEYPYVAKDQTCKIQTGKFKISSYTEIRNCNTQASQVSTQPIAVAADASRWSSYKSGIFDNCGTRLNHGITLVGYKSGSSGYWKIKNSWGSSWGEAGYMRLKLGNTCGICNMSCYPKDPKW